MPDSSGVGELRPDADETVYCATDEPDSNYFIQSPKLGNSDRSTWFRIGLWDRYEFIHFSRKIKTNRSWGHKWFHYLREGQLLPKLEMGRRKVKKPSSFLTVFVNDEFKTTFRPLSWRRQLNWRTWINEKRSRAHFRHLEEGLHDHLVERRHPPRGHHRLRLPPRAMPG